MKPKFIALLAVIVLVSSIPLIVSAQPGGFSSWISVNRTGVADSYMIVGMSGMSTSRFKVDTSLVSVYPPTDLVLTMVGDHEVSISWTAGVNACNYMVRAAVGRVPTDRTDGYLVYYGDSTAAVDFIDEDEEVYYRVWSESCASVWETEGVYDSIGGEMVLVGILLALACGVSVSTFVIKSGRRILGFVSAGLWLLAGIASYLQSSSTWDIYYGIFWLSMGMVLAMGLVAAILREKKEEEPVIIDEVTGEPVEKEEEKTPRTRRAKFIR